LLSWLLPLLPPRAADVAAFSPPLLLAEDELLDPEDVRLPPELLDDPPLEPPVLLATPLELDASSLSSSTPG
jgi:hypothetical protein